MTPSTPAPTRAIVTTGGKRLGAILAELMTHTHSVAKLSGGLRLTWDRESTSAWFALTRPAPSTPGATEIETVRKIAASKITLTGNGEAWTERVERGNLFALWHGIRWPLVVEEVPL